MRRNALWKRQVGRGGGVTLGKSGYIDVPTGMGKTGMLVSIAQAVKLKESPDDPVKVLVLSPTQQILRQTISDPSLKPKDRKGFAKFAPKLRPTAYYADDHSLSALTVMTNASFNALVQAGQMPDFDMVLIDETHTGLGENISDSIRSYCGDKVTIGFSATPDYDNERMTSQLLDHEIFKITLPEAIKSGRLAPVVAEHRELTLDFDEADLPDDPYERQVAVTGAYFQARFADVLKDIKRDIKEGRSVLVRCPPGGDIAYARWAADSLRDELISTPSGYIGPVRAVAVGGSKQNAGELDILLNGFNSGKVHVICYVDAINMGADLPPAKGYYDLSPTKSRVKVVQGMGRALRLITDPDTGLPVIAKVVTYQDPGLGPEQYSCLDALELRTVENQNAGRGRLGRQGNYTPRYTGQEFALPEVDAAVTVGSIGHLAIEHGELETEEQEPTMSFEEACERFSLDASSLQQYLEVLEYEGRPNLPAADYETIAEMIGEEQTASPGEAVEIQIVNPASQESPAENDAPPEPKTLPNAPSLPGHMELSEYARRAAWQGGLGPLRRQINDLGIRLRRVREHGKTFYYLSLEYVPPAYLAPSPQDAENNPQNDK